MIVNHSVLGSVSRHLVTRKLRHNFATYIPSLPKQSMLVVRVLKQQNDYTDEVSVSIEKTIENGIEKVTVIVNARGDVLKEDVEKELNRVFKENNINKDASNINIDININS